MRKKIPEDKKKKSITVTINPYVHELLIKYTNDKGLNKSEFIESLLESKLKK